MTVTPEVAFQTWCAFLDPSEGGLSMDPSDPGNWTVGRVGSGVLKGTKYGIAAADHPDVDIANLTLAQADGIRRSEYWDAINGDALPPAIAFVLADAAFLSGPRTAAREFQAMLGVTPDGVIGPHETIPAMELVAAAPSKWQLRSGAEDLVTEYSSRRLIFESDLGNWHVARGGWTRRLFHACLIAASLA
jgi:lysozyme family protein